MLLPYRVRMRLLDGVRRGACPTEGSVFMTRVTTAMMACSVLVAGAGAALAKPPLRDVPEIDDYVYYTLVAYEIGEQCPTISARKLKGISDLWALGRKAKAMGYT